MKYVLILFTLTIFLVSLCGCLSENDKEILSPNSVSYDTSFAGYAGEARTLMDEMPYAPESDSSIARSPDTEQKLIRSGSLILEVTNVSFMVDRITIIAENYQGFVEKSTMESDTNDQVSGSMIIRVPGENFDPFFKVISSLGTIKRQDLQTTDVTEDYIDKEAQIQALTVQRDQYYRIIEKAKTVEDILNVQREIDRVQLELDRVTGKMKYLENQIAFGTLRISLQSTPVLASKGVDVFSQVIEEALSGFVGMISFLIIFFVTIIPLLIIIYIIYRLLRRAGILRRFAR